MRDHFENNAEAKALLKQVGRWVLPPCVGVRVGKWVLLPCVCSAGWAAGLGLCAGRAPSGPPLHSPVLATAAAAAAPSVAVPVTDLFWPAWPCCTLQVKSFKVTK